jgi:thiosulfate/3-mercaptopyruvate sulfurtransferase
MFKVIANTASNLHATREYGGTTLGQKSALGLIAIFLSLMFLVPDVYAGCACSAVGNWDPSAFLNSDVPGVQTASKNSETGTTTSASSSAQTASQLAQRSDLFPNGKTIESLQSVSSSDVVLDVSNDDSYSQSHIKGALHLPSKSFLNDDGTLKPVSELAKILGNAGVSRNDPIVVYSDNPGEAAFAFWILRYIGQDIVKVLDGGLKDWITAGLPTDTSQKTRPAVEYIPSPTSEILADYDYVKADSAQIVDARPFTEFSKGRIPTAISLDPAKVLVNGKVKNGNDLANVFSSLPKDKPIVVYSSDYSQASLLWYALQLMGYDSKIYTWQDWVAHQPASEKKETVLAGKDSTDTGRFKKLGTT